MSVLQIMSEVMACCYLNTKTNLYFWSRVEIKEMINCDHLVRFKELDKFK